jgi:hypothetical protein
MKRVLLALLLAAAPAGAADPRIDAAAAKVEALWSGLPDRADFAEQQERWKRRVAETCPDAEINCALDQYESWMRFLDAARPHEVQGARLRARAEMRWDSGAGYTIDLAYPEFTDVRFAALNAFAAVDARRRADVLAAEWRGNAAAARAFWPSHAEQHFEVPLVTGRLVTIDFQGHQYNSGAAHGLPSSWSVLFDLDRGRALASGDLFRGDGWIATVTEIAENDLRQRLGGGFRGNRAAVRDVVTQIENWSFRIGEAVITFPVYAVASYADGPQTVTVPYERLVPFLQSDAMLPR